MEYFRDKSLTLPEEFYPFKREAVETVIRQCDFHPRRFLSHLNRIIVEALSKDVKEITPEFVKTVPEVEEKVAPGIEQLQLS